MSSDGHGDGEVDPAVAMMAADTASAALGIVVEEVRSGYARVTMTITDGMLNGHRIAHGGYVFLLADTAFACACNSGRPTTVAATAEIDFLAPVHLGDVLEAEAIQRWSGGRSSITDVRVRRMSPKQDVVAEFRGRSRTLRSPGDSPQSGSPSSSGSALPSSSDSDSP